MEEISSTGFILYCKGVDSALLRGLHTLAHLIPCDYCCSMFLELVTGSAGCNDSCV